ncbi:myb family transcription factor PHL8-like isoform X2 [Hibiscus syriacus]|uniref:myb family transcription factor PHL8-like isoform X2 n=1 Tax=Hibiscus syriacus TaxID=106335 RepID=UPI00192425AF|nr:myb family transcription factor PHL8-like isoform X2 [Hibiscus syriacus]
MEGLQNMQNQDMNLVLSIDAKPRLKWIPELHQRFVDAVNQLGGPDKATPKNLMRVIGISGLTLYHLKSHLQKYRLAKSQQTEICLSNKLDDCTEVQSSNGDLSSDTSDGTHKQMDDLRIAQAFQMQMEVQRKLHEQIEVQRHLQLRIEAQGNYLKSVLKKAQEKLAGYTSSSIGEELAKVELSRLVSMVNTGCTSSSFSELTEVGGSSLKQTERKPMRSTICSMESSLTSSESSGRKDDEEPPNNENICTQKSSAFIELNLMDIHPVKKRRISGSSNQVNGKKRSGSNISDDKCVEQPVAKRLELPEEESGSQLRKCGLLGSFDLNNQYQNDMELGPKAIDLNSRE